jgi:hypothetical protein
MPRSKGVISIFPHQNAGGAFETFAVTSGDHSPGGPKGHLINRGGNGYAPEKPLRFRIQPTPVKKEFQRIPRNCHRDCGRSWWHS